MSFSPVATTISTASTRVVLALLLTSSLPTALAQQAPALLQLPRQTSGIAKFAPLSAPQGLVAESANGGVQLRWLAVAGAAQYLVLRGTDAAPAEPAIASLPAATPGHFDKGFNARASYQIVAVAADGRRSASALVVYQPPPPAKAALALPRAALMAPVPAATAPATLALNPELARTARSLPLAINSVHLNGMPATFDVGRIGDSFVVNGTGLDGVSGVTLIPAYVTSNGVWMGNTATTQTYAAAAFNVTAAALKFVVPEVPFGGRTSTTAAYLVSVSKGSASVTTAAGIHVSARQVPRKILSVAQTAVRAGGRIRITGMGFQSSGVQTTRGYFGVGVPGSTSNPQIDVANLSDTYAELVLPANCDQEGMLMLASPNASGSDTLVTGDQPIIVGCAPGTPSGRIVGTEGAPNGIMLVQPGSSVTIRGTALRYVTRVLDNQMRAYPFTFHKIGSGPSAFEQLSVSIPPATGQIYQFYLENKLTDPVLSGTVAGMARTAAAPTWIGIGPVWAEPGQMVRVAGRDLSNGTPPSVSVGGVPAQVLRHDPLWVEFRLGPGTTAGPIRLQNEGGSVAMAGPFTANTGAGHPGFFVVSGASVLQGISAATATRATGDVLIVTGQNLARLRGICVESSGQGGRPTGFFALTRVDANAPALSNTEMRVVLQDPPHAVKTGGAIQIYAPTAPPGDYPPTAFACVPGSSNVTWSW